MVTVSDWSRRSSSESSFSTMSLTSSLSLRMSIMLCCPYRGEWFRAVCDALGVGGVPCESLGFGTIVSDWGCWCELW